MAELLTSPSFESAALLSGAHDSRFSSVNGPQGMIQIALEPSDLTPASNLYLIDCPALGNALMLCATHASRAKAGLGAVILGEHSKAFTVNTYISKNRDYVDDGYLQIISDAIYNNNTASVNSTVIDTVFQADRFRVLGHEHVQRQLYREDELFKMQLIGLMFNADDGATAPVVDSVRPDDWSVEADRIVRDLGRLQSGWAGPNSCAPLAQAIDDFEIVANMLPPNTAAPLVEVDDDDGYITLRWRASGRGGSFALVFNGKHDVIGTMSPTSGYLPWKLNVANDAQITAMVDREDVLRIITRT
jgi:hypothetical protein